VNEWFRILLALCAVAVTGALVAMLLALKRTLDRAAGVLGVVEDELRPTAAEARALMQDIRAMSRELRGEIERLGEVTDHVRTLVDGLARVANGLAGLTRAGQLIGMAAGVKKGLDVFLQHWRSHPQSESADGHSAPVESVRDTW
jgi:uncharacterized protein YoxC